MSAEQLQPRAAVPSTDPPKGVHARDAQPIAEPGDSPRGHATTRRMLLAVLKACVGVDPDGFGRHIALHVGDDDDLQLEPALYQLLGVVDSTQLLFGVSAVSTADVADCRAEHGEPDYQFDLGDADHWALHWEIWQAPATALQHGPLAGASLVMPARDPDWVVFTDPASSSPMLFSTPVLTDPVEPWTA